MRSISASPESAPCANSACVISASSERSPLLSMSCVIEMHPACQAEARLVDHQGGVAPQSAMNEVSPTARSIERFDQIRKPARSDGRPIAAPRPRERLDSGVSALATHHIFDPQTLLLESLQVFGRRK